MRIILVAGPAGGGKTTWARKLAKERNAVVIHTDDYKGEAWEDVPMRTAEAIAQWHGDGTVIVEGVRALSAIQKGGFTSQVTEVWWCEQGPGKPGKFCRGLEKRQRDLLDAMAHYLPQVQQAPPL
jgi:nicotinamide riboside kinase